MKWMLPRPTCSRRSGNVTLRSSYGGTKSGGQLRGEDKEALHAYTHMIWVGLARTIYLYIYINVYGVYTDFGAGKSPKIRPCMVYLYGSGHHTHMTCQYPLHAYTSYEFCQCPHIARCTFPHCTLHISSYASIYDVCAHVAKSVCTCGQKRVHAAYDVCALVAKSVCTHRTRCVYDVFVWCVCVYDVCALVAKSLCTHRTSVHAAYKSMNVKYQWCAIRSFGTFNTVKFCGKYDVARVGQHHMYTMYTRCFWKGNYQSYGHVRRIYTVLANYVYVPRRWNLLVSVVWFRECGTV